MWRCRGKIFFQVTCAPLQSFSLLLEIFHPTRLAHFLAPVGRFYPSHPPLTLFVGGKLPAHDSGPIPLHAPFVSFFSLLTVPSGGTHIAPVQKSSQRNYGQLPVVRAAFNVIYPAKDIQVPSLWQLPCRGGVQVSGMNRLGVSPNGSDRLCSEGNRIAELAEIKRCLR